MSDESQGLVHHLIKSSILTIIAFALIPTISWLFTQYVISNYRLHASDYTQFSFMYQMSIWLLIATVGILAFIAILSIVAFMKREIQYISFVIGWRLLTVLTVIEVLLQGVITVWLSYWLTVFFFQVYIPKLILVVAVLVAMGVFYAIAGMFKRVDTKIYIEGEYISRASAAQLWNHIDTVAERLNTKAPDHIIAGIDCNFFVTESTIVINEQQTYKGRTLFISLPLLRKLTINEADAILAHELNHLRGGDTTNSAALAPKLAHCNQYLELLSDNVATRLICYPLAMYRLIFELALQKESRQREYMADKAATEITSAKNIIHSLIKVEAYATYRNQIENSLFEQDKLHQGEIGIAQQIAKGLNTFVHSEQFLQNMEEIRIPHPFDSHPKLKQRMENVGYIIELKDYINVITMPLTDTWVDNIPEVDIIEQKLWTTYEQQFKEKHEYYLAHLYQPENGEQEQIVIKFFPPLQFDLKKDKKVQITYQALTTPNNEVIQWEEINKINYNEDSETLTFEFKKESVHKKKLEIKLTGIGKQAPEFCHYLSAYWERNHVMHNLQQKNASH